MISVRNVTKAPYVVASLYLKGFNPISAVNCSYWLTICAPYYSLDYHGT